MTREDIKGILRNVLESNNIPSQKYCIGRQEVGKVCLEEVDNKYAKVYVQETTQKRDAKYHENLCLACFDLIERMAIDGDQEQKMKEELVEQFLRIEENEKIKQM